MIERVTSYKILGVFMDSDLKWNSHVEYIFKKACKKLYSLRVLRRAGVNHTNILKVYLTTYSDTSPGICSTSVAVSSGLPV